MPEKLECVRSHSRLYLPQDLVIEIILSLPAKSVARFRCVSTVWLSISTDPSFILAHTRRISKSLVFHFIPQNLPRRKPVETFPTPQNELFTVCIGKGKFGDIAHVPVSSCDGLVCFREEIFVCPTYHYGAGFPSRGASIKYVLNPLTGLRIDIPSHSVVRFGNTSSACELYYHRWTGQYRLLNAHGSTFGSPIYAEVLSLGGAMNSWRRINATADPDVWVLWEKSVLVNDCLYWICKKLLQENAILVFDISEEAFSFMELPPDVVGCMSNIGLFDIEGKLCCWMVSSDENLIDNYLINIWVAAEGGEKWRSTYSLFLADEWRRPIYPSPCFTLIMFVFFSRGRILFLVCGSGIPYLLSWDLKSDFRNRRSRFHTLLLSAAAQIARYINIPP